MEGTNIDNEQTNFFKANNYEQLNGTGDHDISTNHGLVDTNDLDGSNSSETARFVGTNVETVDLFDASEEKSDVFVPSEENLIATDNTSMSSSFLHTTEELIDSVINEVISEHVSPSLIVNKTKILGVCEDSSTDRIDGTEVQGSSSPVFNGMSHSSDTEPNDVNGTHTNVHDDDNHSRFQTKTAQTETFEHQNQIYDSNGEVSDNKIVQTYNMQKDSVESLVHDDVADTTRTVPQLHEQTIEPTFVNVVESEQQLDTTNTSHSSKDMNGDTTHFCEGTEASEGTQTGEEAAVLRESQVVIDSDCKTQSETIDHSKVSTFVNRTFETVSNLRNVASDLDINEQTVKVENVSSLSKEEHLNSTPDIENLDALGTNVEVISKPADFEANIGRSTLNADHEKQDEVETTSPIQPDDASPDLSSTSPTSTKETDAATNVPIDEWLDILGNGLLKKKVIHTGEGRESRPANGDLVTISYEGKLEDGTLVDKHTSVQIIVGDLDVIQGIDMCVALMENKEICILETNARYAYSLYGRPDFKPPIPQNSNIQYEIEILSITPAIPVEELSVEQRVLNGDKKRIRGNDLYTRKDYISAIDIYRRGLKYLEGSLEKEVLNMKAKLLNNLSAAQLKMKSYKMALQSLDFVLNIETDNVKAIFRKGKCLEALGKDQEALEYMKKASILHPENKQLLKDLGKLRSKVAVAHQKEKEIYQRMFQQRNQDSGDDDGDDSHENSSVWPYIGSAMIAAFAIVGGYLLIKYKSSIIK